MEKENLSNDFEHDTSGASKASSRKRMASTRMALDQFIEESSSSLPAKSELDRYLEDPSYQISKSEGGSFDILGWWKHNSAKYPTFAMLARDVLAIPISTVASESAFSIGGRVLDVYQSSLHPRAVEGLTCAQNWIRSETQAFATDVLADNLSRILDATLLDGDVNASGDSPNIDRYEEMS